MHDADQSTTPTTLEVELKFAIADGPALLSTLHEIGATFVGQEQHADTYYAHPCRDFVQTGEALRIRKVDGVAHVTFKGPKQPGP